MECEKNKEFMLKYVEGSINEKEMVLMSEHIRKCKSCKEEFSVCRSIFEELNNFEVSKSKDEVLSEEFENSIMKNISGIDFKTEQILICIIGMISLAAALIMIIEVIQSSVFYDGDGIREFISGSKNFTDKILIYIGYAVGSALKFISEILMRMKYFSLSVIVFALLGKFIYNIKRG